MSTAQALLARKIVGVAGNVISLGVFLSPLPTFVTIWKKKAVEKFSPVPYLATLLNCMLWVFYGLPLVTKNNTLVVTINGAGTALEAIYLIFFFVFSPKKMKIKMLAIMAVIIVFIAAVIAVVMITGHTLAERARIVGIICVFFGTLMYAAPLTVMKMVIKTKSVEYMPFSLSFASLLNGICWTSYSLLKFDVFIFIPNGLGTLLAVVQLVLYCIYCGSTKKESNDEEKNMVKVVEMASPMY